MTIRAWLFGPSECKDPTDSPAGRVSEPRGSVRKPHLRCWPLGRIGDLGRLTPQTARGYRELSDADNKTAHLDAKTRELIAIAVGVTRQCDGCVTTHVHAAKKHGATKEERA